MYSSDFWLIFWKYNKYFLRRIQIISYSDLAHLFISSYTTPFQLEIQAQTCGRGFKCSYIVPQGQWALWGLSFIYINVASNLSLISHTLSCFPNIYYLSHNNQLWKLPNWTITKMKLSPIAQPWFEHIQFWIG